jgi:Flp pilus assembly protein TadB
MNQEDRKIEENNDNSIGLTEDNFQQSGNIQQRIKNLLYKNQVDTFKEYKSDTEKSIDSTNKSLEETRKDQEKMRKDFALAQTKMKEEIASAQTKIIETVGIFVALFTFISVNVQIFRNVTSLFSAAMFSIILAALIGIMILVFLLVLSPYKKEQKWKKIFCGLLMIFIFFIIVGLVGIFFSEFKLNQDTFTNNSNNDKMSAEVKIK